MTNPIIEQWLVFLVSMLNILAGFALGLAITWPRRRVRRTMSGDSAHDVTNWTCPECGHVDDMKPLQGGKEEEK